MLNKDVNKKLAALIIMLSGITISAYAAVQIDWSDIELSFKSVFFPILFLFILALLVFRVISNKDVDVTSNETDQKISAAIDSFNYKTRYIQNFIIGLIVLVLLAFYLVTDL